jgi:Immunoglobulin-like domain of bacterial spore germination
MFPMEWECGTECKMITPHGIFAAVIVVSARRAYTYDQPAARSTAQRWLFAVPYHAAWGRSRATMINRTLFVIGLLLLLVAGGVWLFSPGIPTSGSPTAITSTVLQATSLPAPPSATPTATPLAQLIMIETPAPGTLVGSPVVITGRTSAYPAQGQLHYRIVIADQRNTTLASGTFTVTGALHHPATFNVSLTFAAPAGPSRITVELFDQDASTQAVVASASVTLPINLPSIQAAPPSSGFPATGTPAPAPDAPTPVPLPTAPPSAPTTEPTAAPVATPPPAPSVVIEAQYPGWMDLGASDTINLSLKHIVEELATATSVRPDRTTVAGAAAVVGTPEVALGQAFGPGYDAVVIAKVVAPAFEVQSTGDEHPLDQDAITWQWGITPKRSGHQVVIVSVDGRWRPQAGGRTIERNLWRQEFAIVVYEPMLRRGQIDLASLATALIGSVLSVPWLVEQIQARRQQRQGAAPAKRRVRQPDA